MNGDDDTRLEDFFLKFLLENAEELEEIVGIEFDGFWKIKQESDEVLMATGTGGDGNSDINIYLNLGDDDKRFVSKIQDVIARAMENRKNYIICIAKNFNLDDVEELMQNVVFYLDKCVQLIFLSVDFQEAKYKNLNKILREEVAIKVYRKNY